MKTIAIPAFGLAALLGLASFGTSFGALAAEPKVQTVAALYQNKATLAGKTIKAQGKVVKVNNQIMGRNFLHLQDGSGKAESGNHDLTITSKQTAAIGDQVVISGVMAVDRDFGSGYAYPLLIEEASITPKK
jgi:hypothetical protein